MPGCEKNKGSILQRAVAFITQLKENETQNIEKWTLEKLLTEQAIAELSQSNDKLKQECERLYRELDLWKQIAQNAGLQPPQLKEEPGSASGSGAGSASGSGSGNSGSTGASGSGGPSTSASTSAPAPAPAPASASASAGTGSGSGSNS